MQRSNSTVWFANLSHDHVWVHDPAEVRSRVQHHRINMYCVQQRRITIINQCIAWSCPGARSAHDMAPCPTPLDNYSQWAITTNQYIILSRPNTWYSRVQAHNPARDMKPCPTSSYNCFTAQLSLLSYTSYGRVQAHDPARDMEPPVFSLPLAEGSAGLAPGTPKPETVDSTGPGNPEPETVDSTGGICTRTAEHLKWIGIEISLPLSEGSSGFKIRNPKPETRISRLETHNPRHTRTPNPEPPNPHETRNSKLPCVPNPKPNKH